MPKIRFSDTALNALKHTDTSSDYYDIGCPSLLLRVGKKTKTFYVYQNRGMHKQGVFCPRNKHGMNVDAARTQAVSFKNSNKTKSSGSKVVKFLYYLENQYAKDAAGLNRKKVSQKTIESLKRQFPHCHDKYVSKINDNDFVIFLENNMHLKENTVRKAYYALSALLNVLVEKDKIDKNPLKKRSLKADSERPIHVHTIERNKIIATLLDDDFGKRKKHSRGFSLGSRLIAALIIDGGYRPSEVILSKVHLYELGKEPSLALHSSDTKTEKPRIVPIFSNQLVERLVDYRNNHNILTPEGYMFVNQRTRKPYAEGIYRAVWRQLKAEFELGGRFYDFRHTFASNAYRLSGDIKMVADLIGDRVETASKYYAQTNVTSAREKLKGMR